MNAVIAVNGLALGHVTIGAGVLGRARRKCEYAVNAVNSSDDMGAIHTIHTIHSIHTNHTIHTTLSKREI